LTRELGCGERGRAGVPVVDEGLGNSSYLLNLGDGRAAVIDPERDPRPYLQEGS